MTANEFLQEAAATLAQRGAQYDPATSSERSAERAATIFNEAFGNDSAVDLVASDVWSTLIAVKLARLRTVKDPTDTLIDIINYFALLGEELTQPHNTPPAV
jgi:hypothetical protein